MHIKSVKHQIKCRIILNLQRFLNLNQRLMNVMGRFHGNGPPVQNYIRRIHNP